MKEINPKKTKIQSLAEFFGWDREKSVKVKLTSEEIAPNGTRRARRINNNFVPAEGNEGDEHIFYINEELKS